jgi:predicted transposase YdaD
MKKGEMGMQLCTALQNLREEGRKIGREEGRKEGREIGIEMAIEKIIEVYLELGMQREFIINKVMEKFDISKKKAEEIANRIIKED